MNSNTWNLTICKQMNSGSVKMLPTNQLQRWCMKYRHKQDLAWNDRQGLKCYKTNQPTNLKSSYIKTQTLALRICIYVQKDLIPLIKTQFWSGEFRWWSGRRTKQKISVFSDAIKFTFELIPFGKCGSTYPPPPAMGYMVPFIFFYKNDFGIKQTRMADAPLNKD